MHALEIFLGQRRALGLALPVDRHDPPAPAVVHELDAIDAALEGFGVVRLMARLIRAEDVRDVTELLGAARALALEETFRREDGCGALDEVFGREDVRRVLFLARERRVGRRARWPVRRSRDEPRAGDEEQSRGLPAGPEITS